MATEYDTLNPMESFLQKMSEISSTKGKIEGMYENNEWLKTADIKLREEMSIRAAKLERYGFKEVYGRFDGLAGKLESQITEAWDALSSIGDRNDLIFNHDGTRYDPVSDLEQAQAYLEQIKVNANKLAKNLDRYKSEIKAKIKDNSLPNRMARFAKSVANKSKEVATKAANKVKNFDLYDLDEKMTAMMANPKETFLKMGKDLERTAIGAIAVMGNDVQNVLAKPVKAMHDQALSIAKAAQTKYDMMKAAGLSASACAKGKTMEAVKVMKDLAGRGTFAIKREALRPFYYSAERSRSARRNYLLDHCRKIEKEISHDRKWYDYVKANVETDLQKLAETMPDKQNAYNELRKQALENTSGIRHMFAKLAYPDRSAKLAEKQDKLVQRIDQNLNNMNAISRDMSQNADNLDRILGSVKNLMQESVHEFDKAKEHGIVPFSMHKQFFNVQKNNVSTLSRSNTICRVEIHGKLNEIGSLDATLKNAKAALAKECAKVVTCAPAKTAEER